MVSDYLIGLFEVPRPPGVRPDGMTVRELLDKGRLQIESDDQVRPEIRARVVGILGSLYNRLGLYAETAPLPVGRGACGCNFPRDLLLEVSRRQPAPGRYPDRSNTVKNRAIVSVICIVVATSLLGSPSIGAEAPRGKGEPAPSPDRSLRVRAPGTPAFGADPVRAVRPAPNPDPDRIHNGEETAPPASEPFNEMRRTEDPSPAPALLGGTNFKLSGPVTAGGDVYVAQYSPDGTTLVYSADQDADDLFELYSVPSDGSAGPTKISGPMLLGPGSGASSFLISPDGTRVVYRATQDSLSPEIYSVPIGGPATAGIKLNGPLPGGSIGVGAFAVSDDGSRVGYLADQDTAGTGEAYSVPIDGSSAPCKVNGVLQPFGNVTSAFFSPDSATVAYLADQDLDDTIELYSRPADCSATPTKLNPDLGAFGAVSMFQISADSTRVVYAADHNSPGVQDLFSVPIGGPAVSAVQVSGQSDFFSTVVEFEISPDSARAAYRADLVNDELFEVYTVPIAGPAALGVQISGPMPGGAFGTTTLNIDPTGSWVTYEADQSAPFEFELYVAPIDGSASSTGLHGIGAGENVGFFEGVGIPIVDGRAIYPVFGPAGVDIFSVPVDGSQPPVQLNAPMAPGGSLFAMFLPIPGANIISYSGETDTVGVVEAYMTTHNGSVPPHKVNGPLTAGGNVADPTFSFFGAGFNSTGTHGAYFADQDTDEVYELYGTELDTDSDGTPNTTDNCRFIANPAQDPVTFGQMITAPSKTEFEWPAGADADYVKGDLATVASYATNDSGSLADAIRLTDATLPGAGAGLWYLLEPGGHCAAGSWQTTGGAQPGRDLNLP